MPDVSVLPTGGMESRGGSGPNWLLIGGAGVGIIGILYVMSKGSSGGQPTTAAGSSINAALGSIQEQNLNIMGQIGQSQATLTEEINSIASVVNQSNSSLASELEAINNNVIAGNQMSLDQLQQTFKEYAQNQFGYQSNLGGNAPALALPQNWSDFMNFIQNPSLANPTYQQSLVQSRGYVF